MFPKVKKKRKEEMKNDSTYKCGVHPIKILLDLNDNGYEQKDIAKKLGKSQSAISQVIKRSSKSITIAKQISDILNKPFLDIWGMSEEEYVSRKGT